jgi:hypothetical protein
MPEPSYRLQRHQGVNTLQLYKIPLRWLIVERLAGPLIEHSLTWRFGNWLFAWADARYQLVHDIPIDDEDLSLIDPEWHRIWTEEDEEARDEGQRHFAPYGSYAASCGVEVPRGEPSYFGGIEGSGRFTDRRDQTTCPECRAMFRGPR